jgi:hypothetical protein
MRPRESWQNPAQPVTGPTHPGWARYTDVAIHYTSAAKIPGDIDAYHRAMQNDYVTSRGFSLGYSVSVDQSGVSREIRGTDFKPAATRNSNDFAMAILVLVDGNDMASPAASAEVRRIIGEWERLAGRQLRIKGHGEYVATGCPGSGLQAQVVLGEFSPRWSPLPPPVEVPPPPPPVVPPPPTPPKVKRMFVCVGNGDDKSDPRRWAYDGFECRLLVDEADYNEISLFWGWMGSSLTSPHWKPLAWVQALGG